jgi:protein SCO1
MPAEQPSNPTLEVKLGKTFGTSFAVLIAGLALLLAATGGGQSFTTETLRRQQVSLQPQQIGAFNITTATGEKTSLNALLANNQSDNSAKKVWLVDFVYTRCQTLCSSLGSIYQQLQVQIEARGLQGKVGLLSISFDPANDDAAALFEYTRRMGLNPHVWQIVTLTDWQDRRRLLDAFGIMVVPAPLGEFEHNAALHVVSSSGKLLRIIDYAAFQTALDAAVAIAQPTEAPQAIGLPGGTRSLSAAR